MRMRLLLLSPLLLFVGGCERETAPGPLVAPTGGAARAAVIASRSQAYDLRITTARDGEFVMTKVLHVTRQRTGAGWHTSIRIDPTAVPAGQPPVKNEIVSIDIDESGNGVMTTSGGRRLATRRGRASIKPGLKGLSITESSGNADVFDILPHTVYAKSEGPARLARLEKDHPGQGVSRGARIVYGQVIRGATMEFEYDGLTGLGIRSKAMDGKGRSETVEHTFVENGGLIIRTSTRNTLAGSANTRVNTRTISHITIDGKEIIHESHTANYARAPDVGVCCWGPTAARHGTWTGVKPRDLVNAPNHHAE